MLKYLCGLNSLRNENYHEENQYLNLVDMILNEGKLQKGRNGNTMAIFGSSMVFSLEDNTVPILTTKKVAWKTCLKELLWFIKGSTNNQELIDQNIKIEPVLISGKWCEIDTMQDLRRAEKKF